MGSVSNPPTPVTDPAPRTFAPMPRPVAWWERIPAPVVTLATPYVVAGCGLSATGTPCATGQWLVGATRVLALGVPVAVQAGSSLTAPTGTPMVAVGVQPRASAT